MPPPCRWPAPSSTATRSASSSATTSWSGASAPPSSDFEKQPEGAKVFLKEVTNPQAYGIAEIEAGRITRIVEKPKSPRSNLAVIGVYMYGPDVFEVIPTLKPSARGELEITDVNNYYRRAKARMTYQVIDGWWADAGESVDSWIEANQLVAGSGANRAD